MMLSGKSQRPRETLALLFIQDKLPAHRRGPLAVIYSILLSRSFRDKSSKDMAFPQPQCRNDHYRKEDKPSYGGTVWKFQTDDITEYRDGKDNVNQAKNRTYGGIFHD